MSIAFPRAVLYQLGVIFRLGEQESGALFEDGSAMPIEQLEVFERALGASGPLSSRTSSAFLRMFGGRRLG